jgi:hypothetical protein
MSRRRRWADQAGFRRRDVGARCLNQLLPQRYRPPLEPAYGGQYAYPQRRCRTSRIDRRWRTFDAGQHRKNSLAAWLPDLLGRAAQSSPEAAPRRAKGAGLYGDGADRATLQPPPLPIKSSSHFPDAPTHAQRNGAACRWCDKLALKQRCARSHSACRQADFACSPSPPTYPRRPGRRRAAGGSPLRPAAPLIRTDIIEVPGGFVCFMAYNRPQSKCTVASNSPARRNNAANIL